MAARKRRTRTVKADEAITIVNNPAPVARRSGRRSVTRRRKGRARRRRSSVGGGGDMKNKLIGTAMGGFAYGFVEKTWGAQIPALPFVGKSGAIALACYFLSPKHPIIKDVGIAAAAIAGYSFGKTGVVSGYAADELVQD